MQGSRCRPRVSEGLSWDAPKCSREVGCFYRAGHRFRENSCGRSRARGTIDDGTPHAYCRSRSLFDELSQLGAKRRRRSVPIGGGPPIGLLPRAVRLRGHPFCSRSRRCGTVAQGRRRGSGPGTAARARERRCEMKWCLLRRRHR
jgi:hypothetical protein